MFGSKQGDSAIVSGSGGKRQAQVNSSSSACFKKLKGTRIVYTSDGSVHHQIGNEENQIAPTQKWRKLLCNNESRKNTLLVKSEKNFRENISVLMNAIDLCAGNTDQWSKEDTNLFYNKIISFVDSWKRKLRMDEKVNSARKSFWTKKKLEEKRDLVTNRLNLLTSVYKESLKFITFSETQKNKMDYKLKELCCYVENTFPSVVTLLEIKDQELSKAREQADEYLSELTETREQLQSFVTKSMEMTQTKQKDTIKKLSEIQAWLVMKNPYYRPNCKIENESLNQEEKIFKDIQAMMEYEMNSAKIDNRTQNTTESVLKTNSSSASLRVSEYEMHLVTLIASYLKVTPFPVSSHSIYSHVTKLDNMVDLQFVESLLRKFPSFFKEVAAASGSVDKNWIYLDLRPIITI